MTERTHVFPPPLDRTYAIEGGRVRTRSLEAHVVDHCNLKCAECCSLSPLVPPWLASVDGLARDLALAARVLAPRIFKLVGGEPLLHPNLVELARTARASGIADTISMTTNGVLLARAPEALFDALDAITISLYPTPTLPASEIAEVEDRARRFEVALNWKRQDQFVRMDRAEPCSDDAENRRIWDTCWIRERCHMLRDGLFSTCTRPIHFQSLAGDRDDFSADCLRLDDTTTAELVLAHLQRAEPLRACARCYGGNAELGPHRQLTRTEVRSLRVWR